MAGTRGHPKAGGRKRGTPNKQTAEMRTATQDFFHQIVSDKREAELWQHFMRDSELSVVNWQAFKRAVEYKRGMPIQPHTGLDNGPIEVTHTIRFGNGA